nr:FkbM family methyltransferase [Sphingomonas hankyongi]
MGFDPRGILDVGAFEGNWTKLARSIWPRARITMIEGNDQKLELLKKVGLSAEAHLELVLLGADDDQEVQFSVMESGSSVYAEHSPVERKSVVKKTKRLDSVIDGGEPIDLIKIDVQGYELEVLRGGPAILERTEAVLIEISLIEINEGAPLLHEVVQFMADNGFLTFDVLELHRRPLDGAMNQLDILFLKETSALRSDKRHWAN